MSQLICLSVIYIKKYAIKIQHKTSINKIKAEYYFAIPVLCCFITNIRISFKDCNYKSFLLILLNKRAKIN